MARVTAPRARTIRKLLAVSSDSTFMALQTRLHDPVLVVSVRIRTALVFGVLLLMVSKQGLVPSVIAISCAAAFGLIIALPAWKRAPRPQATL